MGNTESTPENSFSLSPNAHSAEYTPSPGTSDEVRVRTPLPLIGGMTHTRDSSPTTDAFSKKADLSDIFPLIIKRESTPGHIFSSQSNPAGSVSPLSSAKYLDTTSFSVSETPGQPLEKLEDPKSATLWDSVNITKSPAFTGLFEAMKIDEEFPLLPPPLLETDSQTPKSYLSGSELRDITHPVATGHNTLTRVRARDHYAQPLAKRRKGSASTDDGDHDSEDQHWYVQASPVWTWNQVSPFPTIETKSRLYAVGTPLSTTKTISQQLLECESRMHKLEKLLGPDNPGVISELQRLASLCFQNGAFKKAEPLYLRLATAKQRRIGKEHPDTVVVYLDLIENKIDGGELAEADRIHRGVHSRIVELFGADSELSIRSLLLQANIRYFLPDENTTAAGLQREALQLALSSFGVRHAVIPHILAELASYTVGRLSGWRGDTALLSAAEQLIRRALEIEVALGNQTDRSELYKLEKLVLVLEKYGHYEESIRVTRQIIRRIRALWGYEHPSMLGNLRSLAIALRLKKDFAAAETVIRYCIFLTMGSPGWNEDTTIRYKDMIMSLEILGSVLQHQERWDEAATRFEEVYRSGGLTRAASDEGELTLRESLRQCYTMQGLYSGSAEFENQLIFAREKDSITTFMADNKVRKWGRYESEIEVDSEDQEEEIRPAKKVCPGKRTNTQKHLLEQE